MKVRYVFVPLCLLIALAALTDCSVKKRHYRNGYYVSWKKKATGPRDAGNTTQKSTSKPEEIIEPQRMIVLKQEEQVMASAASNFSGESLAYRKKTTLYGDSCGDVILFRNGDELKVKVIEISPTTIRYRRCDNITGPVFVTPKDKIFKITYANGGSEVFELKNTPASAPVTPAIPVPRKGNGFAITSFVCALLSLSIILGILTGPLAFIFGTVALTQMDKHPEKYKGKWMAVIGLVVGTLAVLILIALIIANL